MFAIEGFDQEQVERRNIYLRLDINWQRFIPWSFVVIFLSLASALNWFGVSRDYFEYVNYYDKIPEQLSFLDSRFEPGFHLLAWMFSVQLGLPFWTLAFAICAVALAIKVYLFNTYLRYPWIAFAVYLAAFYPNQEYTQIRAALAIAVAFWAIHLSLRGRWIAMLLLFITAATFHASIAILFVAFLFARVFKLNFVSGVVLASFGMAYALITVIFGALDPLIVSVFSRLNPLVGSYVDNIAAIDAATITSVNNIIAILMLVAGLLSGWLTRNEYQRIFYVMAALSIVAVVILSQAPIIAVRAKEMLFMSVLFCAFRQKIEWRDMLPIALLLADALLLGFLAVREGVIFS